MSIPPHSLRIHLHSVISALSTAHHPSSRKQAMVLSNRNSNPATTPPPAPQSHPTTRTASALPLPSKATTPSSRRKPATLNPHLNRNSNTPATAPTTLLPTAPSPRPHTNNTSPRRRPTSVSSSPARHSTDNSSLSTVVANKYPRAGSLHLPRLVRRRARIILPCRRVGIRRGRAGMRRIRDGVSSSSRVGVIRGRG